MHDIHIDCLSSSIVITLLTEGEQFSGLIYPKGLATNSSCMAEYDLTSKIGVNNVTYHLPLRSCNTMSNDLVSLPII